MRKKTVRLKLSAETLRFLEGGNPEPGDCSVNTQGVSPPLFCSISCQSICTPAIL